mmetsp:Transcript_39586/g.102483  ORF Transcript_39586/g.102483 Transcript_39586/m.102483 type:complete len:326 (-) Transcript_39586:889-1866(-)
MPTPTCASWIIGTSFAPSPMASVTGAGQEVPFRTMRTICAFCSGETRQAMTTEQRTATGRKVFSPPQALISSRAWPVTSSATACPRSLLARARSSNSLTLCSTASPSPWPASSVMMSISVLRTRVLKPMLRAVSSLSPVSTHSLIPAMRMRTIVSWTPSCSLSSMAVTPTTESCVSSLSAAAASSSSRPDNAFWASSYSTFQMVYSVSVNTLLASTRVRRPSLANSVSVSSMPGVTSLDLSSMMLSAPLTSSTISPDFLRTTTDMRFLADVKAFRPRTWYSAVSFPGFSGAPSSTTAVWALRPMKAQPSSAAASTSAPSSGLSAS